MPYNDYTITTVQQYLNIEFLNTLAVIHLAEATYIFLPHHYQSSLLSLNQRRTRSQSKQPTSLVPVLPSPRSSLLTKARYDSLKSELSVLHHHIINSSDLPTIEQVSKITSKVTTLSRKHRLFTTWSEWKRLQNLRYLAKLLRSRLRQNSKSRSNDDTIDPLTNIYDPIEAYSEDEAESEAFQADRIVRMHEPED